MRLGAARWKTFRFSPHRVAATCTARCLLPAARSNMVRLISGVALAAAALAAILFLPVVVLRVLACVVAALTAHEYLRIVQASAALSGVGPWLLLVAATCWWMLLPGPYDVLWLVLAAVAWVAIEVLFRGLTMDQAGS